MKIRHALAATAALAAMTLALSGCIAAQIPDPGSGGGSTTGESGGQRGAGGGLDGAPAGYEKYYGQELDWESCEGADAGTYDCTTVTAPLDWDDPEGGDIELAMIRRLSDNATPVASLFVNPGGPGGSGLSLIRDSASYAVGAPLMENFDVIGFDPRGVGESTAVACFDAEEMDAYLFDIPPGARNSPEWIADIDERAEEYAAACNENSAGILPYITTVQAAKDLDLLRAVVGDDELHYLGYSYGTFLGATYAELFPDRAGRLVLDGAIDPTTSGTEVGTIQATGFESAIRAFMADCLTTSSCPFSGTLDEAMADLQALLASVDADPIEASDGRLLGADALMMTIVTTMYNEDYWPLLSDALTDVLAGDAEYAYVIADAYYGRDTTTGQYLDNSTEAFNAYNCMDYPDDITDAEADAAQAVVEKEAPTFAPYWSSDSDVSICDFWPAPPTGTRDALTAEGAPPILVIGTTNDPATPYQWAVALADQLSSGVLITYEGEGHTAYNGESACVNDAVEEFLINDVVPTDDLAC